MSPSSPLMIVAFVCCAALIGLAALVLSGRNRRVDSRIENLRNRGATTTEANKTPNSLTRVFLPKLGSPLVPTTEEGQARLKKRLIHAGYYGRHAMVIFLGVKMLAIFVPFLITLMVGIAYFLPVSRTLIYSLLAGGIGMILPGMFLDKKKKKRQIKLRRGIPDALDMIIICLKGGLSLQGAFQKVATELSMAHPVLASELTINQREIQLGSSIGEAMRRFSDRCDLDEIQSLSSVILQSEKLGASLVTAMRVHADALRTKRLQRAEELAHMAGTKMVFPTILCIFPAILLVVIGPAAMQIQDLFSAMK